MDGFRSNLNTLHRYMDYTCAIMKFGRHLSEFTKWPYFSTGINLYWPWNRGQFGNNSRYNQRGALRVNISRICAILPLIEKPCNTQMRLSDFSVTN